MIYVKLAVVFSNDAVSAIQSTIKTDHPSDGMSSLSVGPAYEADE